MRPQLTDIAEGVYNFDVSWFRQIGAILMAVFFVGTPALACLLPDAQLTAEERQCCQHMAEMCDGTGMPASHSCCAPVAQPVNHALQSGKISIPAPVASSALFSIPVLQFRGFDKEVAFLAASPPQSPPNKVPVLRI